MSKHNLSYFGSARNRAQYFSGHYGMLFHYMPFVFIKPFWLIENVVTYTDFPNIMHFSC